MEDATDGGGGGSFDAFMEALTPRELRECLCTDMADAPFEARLPLHAAEDWLQRVLARERRNTQQRHKDLLSTFRSNLQSGSWIASPRGLLFGHSSSSDSEDSCTPSQLAKGDAPASARAPLVTFGAPRPEPCDAAAFSTRPSDSVRSGDRSPPRLSESMKATPDAMQADHNRHTLLSFSTAATKRRHSQSEYAQATRVEQFVRGNVFEVMFIFLIFLNTITMALESQWKGTSLGASIAYSNYVDWNWPWARELFTFMEYIFGGLFALELMLKLACFRLDFFRDVWNYMDAAIVIAWFVFTFGTRFAVDATLLRMARLLRLLRLVRLVRAFRGFDSLVLMQTAMTGSISLLVWTVVVLVLVLMTCALFVQTMVESYVRDDADAHGQAEVFKYYGTFWRSLLSMFEITVGNWMPPCRALVENLDEYWLFFFLIHKMVIGFSVVAVITGIFIQETFKVAQGDDHIMMLQREQAMKTHTHKMEALFQHLDSDGDGAVTIHEFRTMLHDEAVKTWLGAMELDVADVDTVFDLLDDGDGRVTADELVRGVSRLRGGARSVDVASLLKEVDTVQQMVEQLETELMGYSSTRTQGKRTGAARRALLAFKAQDAAYGADDVRRSGALGAISAALGASRSKRRAQASER